MGDPIKVGGASYNCRHCLGPAVDVCDCPCHRKKGTPCKPYETKPRVVADERMAEQTCQKCGHPSNEHSGIYRDRCESCMGACGPTAEQHMETLREWAKYDGLVAYGTLAAWALAQLAAKDRELALCWSRIKEQDAEIERLDLEAGTSCHTIGELENELAHLTSLIEEAVDRVRHDHECSALRGMESECSPRGCFKGRLRAALKGE